MECAVDTDEIEAWTDGAFECTLNKTLNHISTGIVKARGKSTYERRKLTPVF